MGNQSDEKRLLEKVLEDMRMKFRSYDVSNPLSTIDKIIDEAKAELGIPVKEPERVSNTHFELVQ